MAKKKTAEPETVETVERTLTPTEMIDQVEEKTRRRIRIEAIKEVYGEKLEDSDKVLEIIHDLSMKKPDVGSGVTAHVLKDDVRSQTGGTAWGVLAFAGPDGKIQCAIDVHWAKSRQNPDGSPTMVFVGRDEAVQGYLIGKNAGRLEEYAKEQAGANATEGTVKKALSNLTSFANRLERGAAGNFASQQLFSLDGSFIQALADRGISLVGATPMANQQLPGKPE